MALDRTLRARLGGNDVEALAALETAIEQRAFAAALVVCTRSTYDTCIAEAMVRLLSLAAGDELQAFDRSARARGSLAALQLASWEPMLDDVTRAAALGPDGLGPLAVLSMVRDGHVRAAATLALERDLRGLATLALLVRTDDTVPSTAEDALHALERRLGPAMVNDLVPALPLLDRDVRGKRTNAGMRARSAARTVLFSDDARSRAALDAALQSELPSVSSTAARFAVGTGSEEDRVLRVLTEALHTTIPFAQQAWAAREVCRPSTPPGVARALLPRLLRIRAAAVRRAAAQVAHRLGANDVLEELAMDGNASVRSLARMLIGRAGGDEERERLRAILSVKRASKREVNSSRVAAALAALAEVGRPEDFPWVARWLHHPRFRVVADAVRALVGIHASEGLDAFVDVLHDKLAYRDDTVALEAARGLRLVTHALVDRDLVDKRLRSTRMNPRLHRELEALLGHAPA